VLQEFGNLVQSPFLSFSDTVLYLELYLQLQELSCVTVQNSFVFQLFLLVRATQIGDKLSVQELLEIFGDLNNYLVIPHYDKNPAIRVEIFDELSGVISAGEVERAFQDRKPRT